MTIKRTLRQNVSLYNVATSWQRLCRFITTPTSLRDGPREVFIHLSWVVLCWRSNFKNVDITCLNCVKFFLNSGFSIKSTYYFAMYNPCYNFFYLENSFLKWPFSFYITQKNIENIFSKNLINCCSLFNE